VTPYVIASATGVHKKTQLYIGVIQKNMTLKIQANSVPSMFSCFKGCWVFFSQKWVGSHLPAALSLRETHFLQKLRGVMAYFRSGCTKGQARIQSD
jgi:hypothetical protein